MNIHKYTTGKHKTKQASHTFKYDNIHASWRMVNTQVLP